MELVSTFEWNDDAFRNLVLPPLQKDLVRSIVESHSADRGFDDFIKGVNHAADRFLMVDVGSGKEAVDAKIKGEVSLNPPWEPP